MEEINPYEIIEKRLRDIYRPKEWLLKELGMKGNTYAVYKTRKTYPIDIIIKAFKLLDLDLNDLKYMYSSK